MICAGGRDGQRQNERCPGTQPRVPLLMTRRRRSLLFPLGADATPHGRISIPALAVSRSGLCGYPEQALDELRLPHHVSSADPLQLLFPHHVRCPLQESRFPNTCRAPRRRPTSAMPMSIADAPAPCRVSSIGIRASERSCETTIESRIAHHAQRSPRL